MVEVQGQLKYVRGVVDPKDIGPYLLSLCFVELETDDIPTHQYYLLGQS